VPSGKTCTAEIQKQECRNGDLLSWIGSFANESCVVLGKKSCGNTPHGGKETRLKFRDEEVEFGSKCLSEEQNRMCDDGTFLAWSGMYAADVCNVKKPADCGNLSHGQGEVRQKYQAQTVPFGETCRRETQTRSCDNGNLTVWSGGFQFDACVTDAPKSCGATNHGQNETRTRYPNASVPFGQTCDEQVQRRTCTNGVFGNWTGEFTQETCVVEQAASCGAIPHNGKETRVRFETASVPFGQTCVSQEQTRLCQNGLFDAWTGQYVQSSCSPLPPASCGSLSHNQSESRIRYQAASVPHGDLCVSENQTRACNNGSLSNWTGTFAQTSCTPDAAPTPTPTPMPTPSPEPTVEAVRPPLAT
jgi:hypothetical protein